MSALHERIVAIPAELPRADLVALAAARGPLTGDLPRTFDGAGIRQWTIGPQLVLELIEYHMLDVRAWRIRGAELAEVERLAAELPRVEPAEVERWLADDQPLARMRGLRTAAVLGEPWSPALAETYARALTDARAGIRWTALRALALGRWSEAAAVIRGAIAATGDRRPASELLEQLADALEGADAEPSEAPARTKKKSAKKKPTANKKSAKKKPTANKKSAKKKPTANKKSAKKKPTANKKTVAKKAAASKRSGSTRKTAATRKPAATKTTAKRGR